MPESRFASTSGRLLEIDGGSPGLEAPTFGLSEPVTPRLAKKQHSRSRLRKLE
jgi:hypothetical protein